MTTLLDTNTAAVATPRTLRKSWPILIALTLATLVVTVDNSVLNVALPSIARELHAGTGESQWIGNAYSLLFGGLLLTGGNLDTKGGPVANTHGQILDPSGKVIRGLYGVGNCVASASARAYWAGGATLGPILAFAHLAANAISAEPRR